VFAHDRQSALLNNNNNRDRLQRRLNEVDRSSFFLYLIIKP
jgi:hypothetical protein